MTDYRVVVSALHTRINELAKLRDAQDPDGHRRVTFQRQIDELTDRLLAVEQAGPRAEQLDGQIYAARKAVQTARDEAEDASMFWSRIALGTGTVGGFLALVSLLVTTPWWVWAAGALLILATVGSLFVGTKARQLAAADVNDAIAAVCDLENERVLLEPPSPHQALTTG
jgi:hypothetical protein